MPHFKVRFVSIRVTRGHFCSRIPQKRPGLDNFCYALHNMENLPDRPAGLEAELFRLLFESAEISIFTPQERIKYEFDMTTERDIKNQIAYAEEKGLEKGRREERARIIEELRKQGVPEEVIAQVIKTA